MLGDSEEDRGCLDPVFTEEHEATSSPGGRLEGVGGDWSSHLSKLIQCGASVDAEVFNGQLSQRKTPNQRAGLLQRCLRQECK